VAEPLGTAVVDLPHASEHARARFARPGLFPVDALLWTLGEPVSNPSLVDVFAVGPEFDLDVHMGWQPGDVDDVDASDVVKQVSFLHATEGMPIDEFREHYRAHVEVARRHMPALWQYVQNDVVAVTTNGHEAADGVVAISELWFRTTADFMNRYFASPEDEAEFRSHEGFLELPKAFSFVCSSYAQKGL
jgi:hypothetical protein